MAVKDMPIALGHLLGFGVGMLLYGGYTMVFAITIRLLGMRTRTSKSKVIFSTLLALFLTTTTTIVLSTIDNVQAFAAHRDGPGVESYFLDSRNGIRVAKDLLLLIAAILADGLICWRLFIVWARSYCVLILPGILLFTEIVAGLLTIGFEFHEAIQADGKYQSVFRVGSVTICICSAVVNVLVTALIVGRLWRVGRRVEDLVDRNRYTRVIRVLVESGSLYTTTIVVFFICVVNNLHGAYIFVDYVLSVSLAIAPTLIVLHLNYAADRQDSNTEIPSLNVRFQSPSTRNLDEISVNATQVYDFSSMERAVDRYTMQPIIKYRRSVPSRLHASIPGIGLSLPSTVTPSAPSASHNNLQLVRGRLRGSVSQPSFRAAYTKSHGDPHFVGCTPSQDHDDCTASSSILGCGRNLPRPVALQAGRRSEVSPETIYAVSAGPSSTAVDGGQDCDPYELLPPLPSPVFPSPTIASQPSISFAERAGRPLIRERPSEEVIELKTLGAAAV